MDELKRCAHKLGQEHGILMTMLDSHGDTPDELELAVAQAKRVRRAATMVLRALARINDELQP